MSSKGRWTENISCMFLLVGRVAELEMSSILSIVINFISFRMNFPKFSVIAVKPKRNAKCNFSV